MKGNPRRILASSTTLGCVALALALQQFVHDRLGDTSTFSGWMLLVATAGLYLLTVRKKLIRRRLGPVAGWLQMHSYLGTFASFVFLMHIGWPIRGTFEMILAGVFIVVATSGISLAVLSRTTPKRLAAITRDYQLERIPALQLAVATDAHAIALTSSGLGEGATLSEYYQRRLLPFFRSPRSWLYRMIPTGVKRRKLIQELADLDRYLADEGVHRRQTLSDMVRVKDDLDFHFALQTRLRLLFTLHVALTGALALLVGVHVMLVYRFQGAL